MKSIERFFRRYIFSTIGILILFFLLNILLLGAYFVIAGLGNVKNSNFPIEELSRHIKADSGQFHIDAQAEEILADSGAWAMILNDSGIVIWEKDLPDELPHRYTATEVAMFSRWYLDDYPVNIWKRADGLLVVGLPPGDIANYYFSFKAGYIRPLLVGIGAVFCINLLLMAYLFIRSIRRVEKAMKPILEGIHQLSKGKPVSLEEKGELAEINSGLNRAGDYLIKKDNTRAVWIRGISHDIRTPLSVILMYASEIEGTSALPPATRRQAGIILRQSEKLKNLVSDLNLTTKLEYSMQPIHKELLNAVESARQALSEILNEEMPDQYELEFFEQQPGKEITLTGDDLLLRRMLSNLIRNSMVHNPSGCRIILSVALENGSCIFTVTDDGKGISEDRLQELNQNESITSTQESTDDTEHGLGLKIVRQIVKAHNGTVHFSEAHPQGLCVRIVLPAVNEIP